MNFASCAGRALTYLLRENVSRQPHDLPEREGEEHGFQPLRNLNHPLKIKVSENAWRSICE
jgi:hypothetical protein